MSKNNDIINKIVNNQRELENLMNNLTNINMKLEANFVTFTHLTQIFLILGDNIETIFDELFRLENLLAFIRAKSNHHSMFTFSMYQDMLSKLNTLYKKNELLNISFRDYFDVIKVGYYYNARDIILIFKFPIVFPKNYILYHLYSVPNINRHILIPPHPYLAIHEKDFMYIEAECPKIGESYLCDLNVNYLQGKQPDCIERLITTQQLQSSCLYASIILTTEAMEQLDDRHYIITIPEPTRVELLCEQHKYLKIQGSHLVTVPRGCSIKTSLFTIINNNDNIKGQALEIIDLSNINMTKGGNSEITLKLNSINLTEIFEANKKFSAQQPISKISTESNSLYHTTIPFYGIILMAIILCIIFIVAKNIKKNKKPKLSSEENSPKEEACARDPVEHILQHYSRSKDTE